MARRRRAYVRVVENEVAIPASALFGTAKLPDSAPASWLRPHYMREDGRLGFSVHAFVVDDGERRVVVDTCIGNDKHRRNPVWSGLSGTLLVRSCRSGYPADSIDRVLCTHLHLDHVGWNTRLVDGEWVATFPHARYLIARDEWEHASAATPSRTRPCSAIRWPIFAAGLDLVTTDHRVSACVSLEPRPVTRRVM